MIPIDDKLELPDEEVSFVATRSGGPGGQNVNKVSTRVTLRFDVEASKSLTPDQRERIQKRLASRINKQGVLQVTSQRTRSRELNRVDALERFAEMIREAFREDKPRIGTRATRASQVQRLEEKKNRTRIKQARSRKGWDE